MLQKLFDSFLLATITALLGNKYNLLYIESLSMAFTMLMTLTVIYYTQIEGICCIVESRNAKKNDR